MALNDQQRQELSKILDSDLFRKAKDEVLKLADGPVYELLAPEQAMALAIQKGTRDTFRLLHKICEKPMVPTKPKLSSSLNHTKTTRQSD